MKRAEYKVPGGKLVEAEVNEKEGKITYIKISGDFFMHPETAIEELEKTLCNIPIVEIKNQVNRFFNLNSISLFGIKSDDFVKVIKLALSS